MAAVTERILKIPVKLKRQLQASDQSRDWLCTKITLLFITLAWSPSRHCPPKSAIKIHASAPETQKRQVLLIQDFAPLRQELGCLCIFGLLLEIAH